MGLSGWWRGIMSRSYPSHKQGTGVGIHQLWLVIGRGLLLLEGGGVSVIVIHCQHLLGFLDTSDRLQAEQQMPQLEVQARALADTAWRDSQGANSVCCRGWSCRFQGLFNH